MIYPRRYGVYARPRLFSLHNTLSIDTITYNRIQNLRGRVKVPTGGKVRELTCDVERL
jgi:hypothetical protein